MKLKLQDDVRVTGTGFINDNIVDEQWGSVEDLNEDAVMVVFSDEKFDWFELGNITQIIDSEKPEVNYEINTDTDGGK